MKGVILAGGSGTRLRPLTKVTNKHLLPIYKWPMIYYPLHTLIDAGITQILVVSGPDTLPELIDLLGDGGEFGVDLTYRVQMFPGGIPHAISIAEPFVGKEKFVSIHGDNILLDSMREHVQTFAKGKEECRLVLVEATPEAAQKSGVVAFDAKGDVKEFIEKSPQPPSQWVVTGMYMLTPHVFDLIRTFKPSQRGELESTDLYNGYLSRKTLATTKLQNGWIDAGTFDDLIQTTRYMQEHFENSIFAKYASKYQRI
ncbi:MAG: sugar phosphate nucleotidyltransferase [Candidatus Diapherotrites archaeon]|nr:sugar phosphate nucleotidyltransferase [Candidatus Diapherotrites archaeon]